MRVREHSIVIDGLRLHLREAGEGRPVLLIHGIGAHTDMWGALEERLDGLHLIEFDAPGTGRSSMHLYPLTIPALAWLAQRVLDEVEVERADVLGYSLGGLAAQQLALSAPDRVRRLVLVATSCGWGGVAGEAGALINVVTPLRYWLPGFYRRTIGAMAGGRARRDPDWVERHGEVRHRRRPSTWGYMAQLIGASAWTDLHALHHIRQPTLVVTGDDDPLVPAANAYLLANRLRNARLLLLSSEGHLLLMDSQSAGLERIREFLSASAPSDAASWREARIISDEDVRAAIAASDRQVQPWGLMSAMLRAARSSHQACSRLHHAAAED